jgi:hypothetical protein
LTQGGDWRIPSGLAEILVMMGELSDRPRQTDYEEFVVRWLAPLVAVFLRAVRDAALAYDLATETLAAARLQWRSASSGHVSIEWVMGLGTQVLDAAVERRRVPTAERRGGQQPAPRHLTVAEQQEIMALAEHHLELPATAREAADALARRAPPPDLLAELRRSDLVQAEPLPYGPTDRRLERHGT